MIYLITLNYNSSRYTIDFLESLKAVATDYKLILVDNNSNPEDFAVLIKYIEDQEDGCFVDQDASMYHFTPSVRILLVKENQNLGFAAGNNRGIRIAQNQEDFEAVALINNDTEVESNFMDEILRFWNSNKYADLIGCRILYETPKDVIWYDGGKYFAHSTRAIHLNENRPIKKVQVDENFEQTSFITGCFMFISKKCLDTIGLLDESFFMYHEDLEYCIRATRKGFKLFIVHSAVIRHKIVPTSSPFSAYWGARNRFKVAKLHASTFDRLYTILFYLLTRIPRYLVWLIRGQTNLVKAQTKGIIDGLK